MCLFIYMYICNTVDLDKLGFISDTKRWGEPHRASVFTLVHVVLAEPSVKQRTLASGLYVDMQTNL